VRVRRVILAVALVAYLVPLLVGFWLLAFREVPTLSSVYYRFHYLFDVAFTALAGMATGGTAYLMLRSLLAPWARLEEQLQALIRGKGRLEAVGEEHADRVVERINRLLDLQRDFQELEELSKNAVAQEIHDGAVQNLIAARWALRQGRLAEADRAIADAEVALRRAIQRLAPPELAHLPLPEAIKELGRRTGLLVSVAVEGTLPGGERLEVYRIVQHALENARRHGRAERAWVGIEAGEGVRVWVEDDGRGLTGTPGEGQGLGILRARLRLRGGHLELAAGARGGARLTAWWPLKEKRDANPGGGRPYAGA